MLDPSFFFSSSLCQHNESPAIWCSFLHCDFNVNCSCTLCFDTDSGGDSCHLTCQRFRSSPANGHHHQLTDVSWAVEVSPIAGWTKNAGSCFSGAVLHPVKLSKLPSPFQWHSLNEVFHLQRQQCDMKDSAVCLVWHQGPHSLRLRPDAVSSRLSAVLGSEGWYNTPRDVSTDLCTAECNTVRFTCFVCLCRTGSKTSRFWERTGSCWPEEGVLSYNHPSV